MIFRFDGGPAFARPMGHNNATHYEDRDLSSEQEGMSMLDYFAGQALTGLIELLGAQIPIKSAAKTSYEIAEAMLKEREARHAAENERRREVAKLMNAEDPE